MILLILIVVFCILLKRNAQIKRYRTANSEILRMVEELKADLRDYEDRR